MRINGVGANAPYEFGRSFLATNGDGALHLLYIIVPNVLHTQFILYSFRSNLHTTLGKTKKIIYPSELFFFLYVSLSERK